MSYDQHAKADAGKLRLTLVPPEILDEIAKVREYGNAKYPEGGANNWKQVEPERYFEAMVRHIRAAWNEHYKKDPESGLMHLSHAACNLAFLLSLHADLEKYDRTFDYAFEEDDQVFASEAFSVK